MQLFTSEVRHNWDARDPVKYGHPIAFGKAQHRIVAERKSRKCINCFSHALNRYSYGNVENVFLKLLSATGCLVTPVLQINFLLHKKIEIVQKSQNIYNAENSIVQAQHYINIFSFATRAGSPQQREPITVGPYYLTHSVNFPCRTKPVYPEKTHDFRQSVDYTLFT